MKRPLYYTFGNHMHWVDMQWLWGYDVLPGCVDDMLRLIEQTGARGNVNFDAVGYEKMAAECPEALSRLRRAVEAGVVEPVGCSYGQPYGLFHGGESNIRQFTLGVRSTHRLLNRRPTTFWEEEFYFFDQLPQMLRRCGFSGACLFFQWTWHTPELPTENAALIHWRGIDGSTLPAAPRNALNVHQWPEDFDGLLAQGLINELNVPAVVQWLELMPSRDWMCRSEVLLPRLTELMSDERFDVRPRTAGQLISELRTHSGEGDTGVAEPRRYHPDDVWHGMTLGKNADRHPRTSRRTERMILAAESASAVASLLGRPYASWDVYPTWELDEAWRELLAAQHHDNHECEGLCGFVGYQQMAKAQDIAGEVLSRVNAHLEDRSMGPVSLNPLGWSRRIARDVEDDAAPEGYARIGVEIPPFGYAGRTNVGAPESAASISRDGSIYTLSRDGIEVDVDVESARILQIRGPSHSAGALDPQAPLLDMRSVIEGRTRSLPRVIEMDVSDPASGLDLFLDEDCLRDDETPRLGAVATGRNAYINISIPPGGIGVDVIVRGVDCWARPDPGLRSALRMPIVPAFSVAAIRADSPYAFSEVRGGGRVCRKYPEGDWMTSPQWFERVDGSIISHSALDLLAADGTGLLVLHNGSQQWFRTSAGVEVVVNAYDPWDERRYEPDFEQDIAFRFTPHGGLRDVQRARLAMEFLQDADGELQRLENRQLFHAIGSRPVGGGGAPASHPIPTSWAPIAIRGADNVLCHAFYRESMKAGENLPDWAGHEMARRSDGACTHPFVLRLVEWDGQPAEVSLAFPGAIASAAKTNLMGEVGADVGGGEDTGWLTPATATPPESSRDEQSSIEWSQVSVTLKPREIATIMLDLQVGRKAWRNLDEKRQVWATVHRTTEDGR
ncbi:MAG TPA: hypothetical protein PK093_05025 [Phycisphaerae bacterium]|nr:hypothetical protein [Phycisphaerae bacterium]